MRRQFIRSIGIDIERESTIGGGRAEELAVEAAAGKFLRLDEGIIDRIAVLIEHGTCDGDTTFVQNELQIDSAAFGTGIGNERAIGPVHVRGQIVIGVTDVRLHEHRNRRRWRHPRTDRLDCVRAAARLNNKRAIALGHGHGITTLRRDIRWPRHHKRIADDGSRAIDHLPFDLITGRPQGKGNRGASRDRHKDFLRRRNREAHRSHRASHLGRVFGHRRTHPYFPCACSRGKGDASGGTRIGHIFHGVARIRTTGIERKHVESCIGGNARDIHAHARRHNRKREVHRGLGTRQIDLTIRSPGHHKTARLDTG